MGPPCLGAALGKAWSQSGCTIRPRRISDVCRTSCAGPWEHAGAMLIGASIGAGLAALNESEKAKFDERQKVQRLRNAGLLPIPSAAGGDAEEAGGDEDY